MLITNKNDLHYLEFDDYKEFTATFGSETIQTTTAFLNDPKRRFSSVDLNDLKTIAYYYPEDGSVSNDCFRCIDFN